MVTVQQAAAARQIEQQQQLEQSNIRTRLNQMIDVRNQQMQAEADKAYQKRVQEYVDEMKKQGFKPVYADGKLSGFEDVERQMSVPLQNIDKYISQVNAQIAAKEAAYNKIQESLAQQRAQPSAPAPKWFEFYKPGQVDPITALRGLIPSERLTYEVERMIETVEKERQKAVAGKENTFSAKAAKLLINVGYSVPQAAAFTTRLAEHPYKESVGQFQAEPVGTTLFLGGLGLSAVGLPEVGVPLIYGSGVYARREQYTTDPLAAIGGTIGDIGAGLLIEKAVRPVVTEVRTTGAGKEFNIKTIETSAGKVRYIDLVNPEGKPIRVLLQEGVYAASEKPAVIAQLKYAAEAKGIRVFSQVSPKAIKTVKLPSGEIGFKVGMDRGLYLAPESLITERGAPQAYTYYGELSGQVRDISFPRYIWEKYVQGKNIEVSKGGRAVINIIEREFPDMPGWTKEVLVKRASGLSNYATKAVNYWAKLFDAENKGKVFKFKDKAGVVHDMTPDGLIKSIIKKENPTLSELKSAKALYWWNVKTARGLVGGPEFITLPHGPEWQLVEPFGKEFAKISPTLREKALRKLGIERGYGYSVLDESVLDINFFKQVVPIKEKGVIPSKTPKIETLPGMDAITNQLMGEVERRPQPVRVKTVRPAIRPPAARMNELLVGREGRELARREVERAIRRPSRPIREAPREIPRGRERFSLIPERVPPARPERPRLERPRPFLPRLTERPGPARPRPTGFTLTPPPIVPRPRQKKRIGRVIKFKPIKKKGGYRVKPTVTQEIYGLTAGPRKGRETFTGFELARV